MRLTASTLLCLALPLAACVDAEEEPDVAVDSMALVNHQPPGARGLPQADFDGDGALDLVLKLDKGGPVSAWFIDYSENGFGEYDVRVQSSYGGNDVQPVPADYNCDGRADIATVDGTGAWRIDFYNLAHVAGNNGGFLGVWDYNGPALPSSVGTAVPADYNQDNCADMAVKGDDGVWRIDYYEATDLPFGTFGFAGWDVQVGGYGGRWAYPVPADYRADGDTEPNKLDLAVRTDDGFWLINRADETEDGNDDNDYDGGWDEERSGYGTPDTGMVAAAADFDGDGKADLSVRSFIGLWFIDLSRNGYGTFDLWPSGYGSDWNQPLPGDYTNDGYADLAVKDDCGSWYIDWAVPNPTTQWPIYGGWDQVVDWAVPTESRTVANFTELTDALAADFVGTITLGGGALLDVGPVRNLIVPSCKRITSDRGGLRPGGTIAALTATQAEINGASAAVFVVIGDGVRFDHLRLRGPSAGTGGDGDTPNTIAVKVLGGRNFRFDHNEVFSFPRAAVSVNDDPDRITQTSGIARIEDNFFHHNQRHGTGYGVVVGTGAWAQIERNVFNWHRHGVAHDGEIESGYFAYRNFFLEGTHGYYSGTYYGQHLDVHGDGPGGYHGNGGERFDIAWNTVRGEQSVTGLSFANRPVLRVRGEPTDHIDFHDNVVVTDQENAITNCWANWDSLGGWPPSSWVIDCTPADIQSWNNVYDVDQTTNIGVGDLDGDARSDIFLATGNTWWYSSGGIAEWRFLRQAGGHASSFRYADVDGVLDSAGRRRDDVIWVEGTNIMYSSAGTGPVTVLTNLVGPSFTEHHFANFYNDNNPRVDIFARDANGQWYLWNYVSGWLPTMWAATAWNDLRFGEFDSIPGNDVLARRQVGTVFRYRISSGAVGPWTTITSNDYGLISGTVVADFDGNGRSDLAVRNGNNWWWMPGATGGWATNLRVTSDPTYADLNLARFGWFDETPGADAIRIVGTRFSKWTRGPSPTFVPWSLHEMR